MSGVDVNNTLATIKRLQDKEQQLYSSLGVREDGRPLKSGEQQKILDEINSLSDLRINLINELKNQHNSLTVNVKETNNDLQDELDSIAIMEDQLNEKKTQLQKLKDIRNNKLRMVQINTYYADRAEYVSSIYYTIVVSLAALVVVLVVKRFLFFIPSFLLNGIASSIVVVSIVYIGYKLMDLYSRDSMVFNTYDYSNVEYKTSHPPANDSTMAQLEKVRDTIITNEKAISSRVSDYFSKSPDATKTSNDKSENFQILFTDSQFTPNDPYELSQYEMNFLH